MGHRRSIDLDLFSETAFDATSVRDRLRVVEGLSRVEVAEGTVHLLLNSVKISFLHYPYPLLFPPGTFDGLAVADDRDIACMKLDAIASRGSRRDFVDLYVAARAHGLGHLLDLFDRKFASVAPSRVHLLKALTYFVDAERDPAPDMLIALDWRTIQDFLLTEAPRLARR
jgi:hypothetical protein